ncbi:MAG: hypothetical protein MUO38_04065, partial [Anaerolineales bacterium]|nr:hypothetical protein [Anaerolineales bacterium]
MSLHRTLPAVVFVLAATACARAAHTQSGPPETPAGPIITLPSPGASVGGLSPLCPDPSPPLVTDLDVRQAPDLPEPAARLPFRDPVFGTCLVRVTDREADLAEGDTSPGLKNEYSRVQSFNADGSRMLVRGIEGTWYLYDAASLQPLTQLPLGTDPRWDGANPDLIYYSEDTRLMAYDIQSAQASLLHEFAADLPGQEITAVWTRYEGSPSLDSRYWGLMAENQDWMTVAYLVYDRETDQVIGQLDMPPAEIDSVTISPLGTYFLAYLDEYCEPGQLGDEA